MNFDLTDDRRMLSDSLQRYVLHQYSMETRNRWAYTQPGFNRRAFDALAELGVLSSLFPESYGGFGGSGFDISNVFEALGKGLVVEPFLDNLIVGHVLLSSATHRPLVEALAQGTQMATLAWEEPHGRYNPMYVATTATQRGDQWTLDGAKCVARNASTADVLLVSARVSGAVASATGISLFLVDRASSGVSLRTLGCVGGGSVSEVLLTNVVVDSGALVGASGHGMPHLQRGIGAGVLALCAEAVGAMQTIRDDTLDYLRTRKQFGVPIGSFQALQHRMATVALEIEQARSSVINAASLFDGDDLIECERALSAAKYTIGRIGTLVAEEAVQMHGGIGMTWELRLSHYAKRLVMIDHQLGDEDFHLQRYIRLGPK